MSGGRLVVVLGYSDARGGGLHPVCAARLRRAEGVARPGDRVLLSGWARRRRPTSEAELMRAAWSGPAVSLLADGRARSTLGNVLGGAAEARASGADEVVLVTSSWHARRAELLLRSALRSDSVTVSLAVSDDRGTVRARARELLCWLLVPFLAVGLRSRVLRPARSA